MTILNVNYPPLGKRPNCSNAGDIKWVLTRALPTIFKDDIVTCGNGGKLPTELEVVEESDSCFASVSVLNASSKMDAGRDAQQAVLETLVGLGFVCLED